MSMHIKSPEGTPDIDIHSVRVKPTTMAKTITANGTYNASADSVDGYSAVTVAVHDIVANDKLEYHENYVLTNVTIDLRQPFDIIACFTLASSDLGTIYGVIGSDMSKHTVGTLMSIGTDGDVGGFLFYGGDDDWSNRILIIAPVGTLITDGATKNFMKISRTADGKFTISHSTDGRNFTVAAEQDIPSGLTFVKPVVPVEFGAYTGHTPQYVMPANRLSLANSCIKQNGTVIWGREV